MTIKKISHYSEEEVDCIGNYFDIELQDEKGNVIAGFGDDYHDDGDVKAQGFIKGVEWVIGEKVEFIEEDVADREKW